MWRPFLLASSRRWTRAREWTAEVEDAYRLQEAGYKDEREALSLGHPPLERWPAPCGFIRKLATRESLGHVRCATQRAVVHALGA